MYLFLLQKSSSLNYCPPLENPLIFNSTHSCRSKPTLNRISSSVQLVCKCTSISFTYLNHLNYNFITDCFLQAVLSIQAAFRGHRSRNQLLQKHHYDDYDDYNDYDDYVDHDDVNRLDEDDVILMQAAFRGHKVRQALLQKEESMTPYNRYDDDDDDIAEPPRFMRLVGL